MHEKRKHGPTVVKLKKNSPQEVTPSEPAEPVTGKPRPARSDSDDHMDLAPSGPEPSQDGGRRRHLPPDARGMHSAVPPGALSRWTAVRHGGRDRHERRHQHRCRDALDERCDTAYHLHHQGPDVRLVHHPIRHDRPDDGRPAGRIHPLHQRRHGQRRPRQRGQRLRPACHGAGDAPVLRLGRAASLWEPIGLHDPGAPDEVGLRVPRRVDLAVELRVGLWLRQPNDGPLHRRNWHHLQACAAAHDHTAGGECRGGMLGHASHPPRRVTPP
eukprot:5389588-Prymnesium_polylepis.1